MPFTLTIERLKEIRVCVQNSIDVLRKEVELLFNADNYHKTGRSGGHGKKFNIISSAILRKKNESAFLQQTGCFTNNEEKIIVQEEFEKIAERFRLKAKSINHK